MFVELAMVKVHTEHKSNDLQMNERHICLIGVTNPEMKKKQDLEPRVCRHACGTTHVSCRQRLTADEHIHKTYCFWQMKKDTKIKAARILARS